MPGGRRNISVDWLISDRYGRDADRYRELDKVLEHKDRPPPEADADMPARSEHHDRAERRRR